MLQCLLLTAALAWGPGRGEYVEESPKPATSTKEEVPGTPEEGTDSLLPVNTPTPLPEEKPPPAPEPPERWFLMKILQGTYPGALLDDHRLSLHGWLEASYTASTADISNLPVAFNDRANEFLFQQAWVRFERKIVTSGTTEPSFGFRTDWLFGSDYRYTLMRGLWNSQLLNGNGNQNLYGVDPVQFYVNAYFPNLFQGIEVRLGRHFCPFGVESIEAISTPFLSRSYAFTWSPPFTHLGLMAITNLSPKWTVTLMLINGNDVFLDPAQEMRFAGRVQWTSASKRDSIAFGTSLGRGKFNTGEPFEPATLSLPYEPAGQNNLNCFDLVYTHAFTPQWNYTLEIIYGYQTGVPAGVPGGIVDERGAEVGGHGTANWGSLVNYLFYTINPRWQAGTRFELFDDFEGQRTGFEGLYTALTMGLQYKPRKSLLIRPEIRYDYNGYSRPFEGEHGLLTASADLIFRW
jgi:hypothetical protein